jgi:hypothetical protein
LAVVQIVETYVDAPNAPTVNTGQPFEVVGRIANVSTRDGDPFYVQMVSDGTSQFTPLKQVGGVPAEDTVDVVFDVVASSEINRSEIFRIDIASTGVSKLLPIDNIAQVTVQRPADLVISLTVRGADGGYVGPEESFDLLIEMTNRGDAGVSAARFEISTGDIYLGLPDSALVIEEEVTLGEANVVTFTAPAFDTVVTIEVDLIDRPLDVNSGLEAPVNAGTFRVQLAVTTLDVELIVEAVGESSNLARPEEMRDLFALAVTNPGVSSVTDMRLDAIQFVFNDRAGNPINVRSVIELGSTGLFLHDRKLTSATAGDNLLNLNFADYVIGAGQTDTLVLRAKSKANPEGEFFVTLGTAGVFASFATGPLSGLPVTVITPSGEEDILKEVFTSVTGGLEESFVVRDNPFSPLEKPAEFRYFLEADDEVAFRILTLAGELVHERIMTAGGAGASAGENTVYWNGRNDHGDVVTNGVYVAVVSSKQGRNQAIIKLAVMK